jgi:hypothetical protein
MPDAHTMAWAYLNREAYLHSLIADRDDKTIVGRRFAMYVQIDELARGRAALLKIDCEDAAPEDPA